MSIISNMNRAALKTLLLNATVNRFSPKTQRFEPRLDVYYLSGAYRRAANSKKYPFSSKRQEERYRKNYGAAKDGTIFSVGRNFRAWFKGEAE